ncbi:response regulator transcription factor [Marinoscillum sp.]|uniref:response regulator transcription factor n=1 Tax=Marinoscillum sp. TaxID=2024838 RepID=UPI003BABA088
MKSILIIDDHDLIRDAIKYYFKGDQDFYVAGEASNGYLALDLLAKSAYDVVICDMDMPEMNGIEFMEAISKNYPNQKVLVLSMHDNASAINKMISLGAHGYILKNASKVDLKSALIQIIGGSNYFSKEVYKAIINRIVPKQRLTLEKELSSREKEILNLIAKEYSNHEIGDKLGIHARTVESHKRNILEKTGCKNIAGLVMYAVERDLISKGLPGRNFK